MPDESLGNYELVILLGIAFRRAVDELHVRLSHAGFVDVRPAHGFAFQLLSFKSVSVNELAQHLDITKQAASQMVEFLEQHGYVTRQLQLQDKRSKLVSLTTKGWACIKETEKILAELEAQWIALLGYEKLNELRLDLRKLVMQTRGGDETQLLRPVW